MQRSRFVVILSLLLTVALCAAFLPTMLVRADPVGFSFTATKLSIANDGTDTTDVTVTVLDNGNPVADGTPVTFAVTPNTGVVVTPSLTVNTAGGNGTATINITTTGAAGLIQVTATVTDPNPPCTANCTSTPFDIMVLDAALPNSGTSTIAAAPTSIAADGTTLSTITVTLLNAAGTAIPGVTLTVAPATAGPTVNTVSGTTDAAGVATFTAGWLNADLAAPQIINFDTSSITGDGGAFTLTTPITFTTPALPSQGPTTIVAAPTSILANNTQTSTITVTLLNAASAPVVGKTISLVETTALGTTITPTQPVTNASGVATFTVQGATIGTATFQATDTTDTIVITETASVTLVSPLPVEGPSTVVAAPLAIPADGATTSTVTVTLRTALNTPVQGKTVTLLETTVLGGITITPVQPVTDVNGVATFTVRGTTIGSATFRATDTTDGLDLINDLVTITLQAPPANKTNSTVVSDKLAVFANNVDTATITVTLRDAANLPLQFKQVRLTATAQTGISVNNLAFPAWPVLVTDVNGVVVFTVKSNTAYASVSFTANVITDSVVLDDPADVIALQFIAPTADKTQSQVFVSKTSVFANGTDSATISVQVRDVSGFPIPNKSVGLFSISFPSGVTLNDQSSLAVTPVLTNGNGIASFIVKSTSIAANVTFVFRVDPEGVILDDIVDAPVISFVAPVPTNTPTSTPTMTPTGPTPTSTSAPGTSAALSTVSCDFTQAPADGVFRVTISIVLRDQNSQPVANHLPVPAVIPPTAGLSFSSPALTDVTGRVTYFVSSVTQTAPNAILISVTDTTAVPNVILAQTCTIIFGAPGSTPVVGPTPIGGLTLTPIGTITVTPSRTQTGLLNAADQGPITGIVVAYRLRVRTGPGLNYEILGLLRYKVTIVLLGRNRAGTWVLTQLDDGRQVWVSSRWVKISRVKFRRLPLIDVPPRTPLSPIATPTVRPIVNPSSFIVPSDGQGIGTANVAVLNTYSAPSSDAAVVGELPRGTQMLILGKSKDGNWYYVEARADRGWVPATYVSLSKINGVTLGVIQASSS